MPQYIIDLWLDGYDTEAEMEKACDEFIYEQLNFTASSVKVKRSDYAALLARHNALKEAVAKYFALRETQRMKCVDDMTSAEYTRYYEQLSAARAEVDKLLEEK